MKRQGRTPFSVNRILEGRLTPGPRSTAQERSPHSSGPSVLIRFERCELLRRGPKSLREHAAEAPEQLCRDGVLFGDEGVEFRAPNAEQAAFGNGRHARAPRAAIDERHLAEMLAHTELSQGVIARVDADMAAENDEELIAFVALMDDRLSRRIRARRCDVEHANKLLVAHEAEKRDAVEKLELEVHLLGKLDELPMRLGNADHKRGDVVLSAAFVREGDEFLRECFVGGFRE